MNNTKLMRLTDGSILISEVEVDQGNPSNLILKDPLQIHISVEKQGQANVQFYPVNPFETIKRINMNISSIVFTFDNIPVPIMARYMQETSGIVVPDSSNGGLIV